MLRRSLVTKIYAYGVTVFVVMFLVAFGVAHLLIAQSEGDAFSRFGADHALFIAEELEASYVGGKPSPARLAKLSESLHAELQLVPWKDLSAYPALLASDKVLPDRSRGFGPARSFWVRLDVRGEPQAALHVAYRFVTHRPGYVPAAMAAFWMAMLAMIIIPPLYVLVLRPLRKMVAIAHRLGEGDLATPVPQDRTDEFGELERAFESLRVRIRLMLEQKQRLLTDISHELRGPLSRLSLALPMARESGDAVYFDEMKREHRIMNELIGELLAYAGGQFPQEATFESVDLTDLAREAADERARAIEARPTGLVLDLQAAVVRGDRRLLLRAVGNLLDNALKYGRPGGTIRLTSGIEGDQAVLRVEDDGPGIPARYMPHLFEPFYRPDDSRSRETGGVGLGLSIVKAIADGHGGTVDLTSVEGEGTRVALRLPVRPELAG